MGLLVDSHVGTGKTDKNIELKALAQDLLKDVPYINRKSILYGRGNKTKAEPVGWDFEIEKAQREPGKSIFDVLSKHAMERGLLFWCQPDGTLVFGHPKTSGSPEFTLVNRLSGQGNNILSSSRVRDISRRFSTVTVIGQQQGEDFFAPEQINKTGTATDPSFPFRKPYFTAMAQDMKDPDTYAALIMNRQKFEGLQLSYVLPDHSQNEKNYQANTICHVKDEYYGYDKKFLIYGRTFELTEEDGPTTTLKLSRPGVRP